MKAMEFKAKWLTQVPESFFDTNDYYVTECAQCKTFRLTDVVGFRCGHWICVQCAERVYWAYRGRKHKCRER